jgi:hypothetical protein
MKVAYESGPRRAKNEPITIAVIPAGTPQGGGGEMNAGLLAAQSTYGEMFSNSLKRVPNFNVIEEKQVQQAFKMMGGGDPFHPEQTSFDYNYFEASKDAIDQLKRAGIYADIYVFIKFTASIKSGSVSGHVLGKRDLGETIIDNFSVNFDTTLMSRFAYKGISNEGSGVSVAAYRVANDNVKGGQTSGPSGAPRNYSLDASVINNLTQKMAAQIDGDMRQELPSYHNVMKYEGDAIRASQEMLNAQGGNMMDLFKNMKH